MTRFFFLGAAIPMELFSIEQFSLSPDWVGRRLLNDVGGLAT